MSSFRLEEKLANVESENKVLRQQAVSMAPSKILSGRSKSNLQVSGCCYFFPIFIFDFFLQRFRSMTCPSLFGLQRNSENVQVSSNDPKTAPVSVASQFPLG
jgi:myosin V